MYTINARLCIITVSIALLCSLVVSIIVGATPIPIQQFLYVAVGSEYATENTALIIQHLRLPRTLLAALVGAMLAISGTALQGLFRNPLADPSLIGVTAGASAGASIIIVLLSSAMFNSIAVYADFFNTLFHTSLVASGAFIGGLLAVYCVYRLATSMNGTSVSTMLLAGIAITALAGSINTLLDFYADNATLRRMSLWRMGGIDAANWAQVLFAATIASATFYGIFRHARTLNALLLGESEARHLGVDVEKSKRQLIIYTAASVATAVSLTGVIAFIGLVVPHILRLIIGPNHRFLLPATAFGGALLLVIADVLCRVILAPIELPVGLITAIIGAPFFILLLRKRIHF